MSDSTSGKQIKLVAEKQNAMAAAAASISIATGNMFFASGKSLTEHYQKKLESLSRKIEETIDGKSFLTSESPRDIRHLVMDDFLLSKNLGKLMLDCQMQIFDQVAYGFNAMLAAPVNETGSSLKTDARKAA